ncbi:MAG TPA: alpha/beta hydrolase, partial [Solirubrobacteraceae bacterium]|nr:alpha/beta hydrolase [Solirubrobacteraceae bacterium]
EHTQRLIALAFSGDREELLRFGWGLNVSAAFAADASNWERYSDMAHYMPAAIGTLIAQMQAVAGHDTSARLGQIRAATLVIHGTEDQMVPFSNAALIAYRIEGARLEVLDAVGHLFFLERPERSAELLREHAQTAAQPVI